MHIWLHTVTGTLQSGHPDIEDIEKVDEYAVIEWNQSVLTSLIVVENKIDDWAFGKVTTR